MQGALQTCKLPLTTTFARLELIESAAAEVVPASWRLTFAVSFAANSMRCRRERLLVAGCSADNVMLGSLVMTNQQYVSFCETPKEASLRVPEVGLQWKVADLCGVDNIDSRDCHSREGLRQRCDNSGCVLRREWPAREALQLANTLFVTPLRTSHPTTSGHNTRYWPGQSCCSSYYICSTLQHRAAQEPESLCDASEVAWEPHQTPGPMICNVALRDVAAGLIGGGGGGLAGGGGDFAGGGDATGACSTHSYKRPHICKVLAHL